MLTPPIDQLIDALPSQGMTVQALKALDYIAPGQWVNINRFDNMIRVVTGNGDEGYVKAVRQRALAMYADENQGYQRAVWIYQMVDATDSKLGMAALANKAGELLSILSFLSKITPKADTTQSIDLAMKIIAELMAFRYVNLSAPGDGVMDFANGLLSYQKENLIRMAALLTFDGLIPLGPDFARKLLHTAQGMRLSDLESNATYQRLRNMIPGGVSPLQFVSGGVGALSSHMGGFTNRYGISTARVIPQLRGIIEFADDKLDYVAGFLDMSTNYMEHTGIQSVARVLIARAAGQT
ncbi:MAG: hypothetical protein JNK48_23075 [Bryobacterales bacterium]|nr:hypothetical protein [Bryobacterales bacterium]